MTWILVALLLLACRITGNMHIKLTDSSLAQGFFPEQYDIVEYGQTRELVSMRWRAYEVLFEKKHPSFLSEKVLRVQNLEELALYL